MKDEKQKTIPLKRTLFPKTYRKKVFFKDNRPQSINQAKLIHTIQQKSLENNFLLRLPQFNQVIQRTPVVINEHLVAGSDTENLTATLLEIMWNCAFKGGDNEMSFRAYQRYFDAFSRIALPTQYDIAVLTHLRKEMDKLVKDESMDKDTTEPISDSDDSSSMQSDESESSIWDEHSLDESESRDLFKSSSAKSKQPHIYQTHKHMFQDAPKSIKTSPGLRDLVRRAHGGKSQFTANTHLIYYKKGTKERTIVESSTVNSVLAIAQRFGIQHRYNAVNNELKGKHCHTEMYLLWKMTEGDETKVNGILEGYKLVVDKEICADCWEYIQRANPDKIEDGGGNHTTFYPIWYNPFTKVTKRNPKP